MMKNPWSNNARLVHRNKNQEQSIVSLQNQVDELNAECLRLNLLNSAYFVRQEASREQCRTNNEDSISTPQSQEERIGSLEQSLERSSDENKDLKRMNGELSRANQNLESQIEAALPLKTYQITDHNDEYEEVKAHRRNGGIFYVNGIEESVFCVDEDSIHSIRLVTDA